MIINNDKDFFDQIRSIEHWKLNFPNDPYFQRLVSIRYEEVREYNDRTSKDRIGDWTITPCGRRFWLLDPRPEDIHIEDIAKGLAGLGRFNGQLLYDWYYSVAEHCWFGSLLIDSIYAKAFLFHDASECYTGDLIYPMKKILALRKPYKEIEEKIELCIYNKFNIEFNEEVAKEVKKMDKRLLAQEMRDFTIYRKDLGMSDEKPTERLGGYSKSEAERLYLSRYKTLFNV